MRELLRFEIRNRNKLLKYFVFGIIGATVMVGMTFGVDYLMTLASKELQAVYQNNVLLGTVIAITTMLLLLQLNKSDEFEPSSTVGIAERKERGIFLYLSRLTFVCIVALYAVCLIY